MTPDQIWERIVHIRPELANDLASVEMSAINLRLLLKQVWEQGNDYGRKQGKKHCDSLVIDRLFEKHRWN